MSSCLITIGKITRYQGNKGEVRVHPLTDLPERFKVLNRVYLQKNAGETIEKKIENVRLQNNKVIIKFEDVENIDQAVSLKDYYLKIEKDIILPLKKDQYYIYKLIDFNVETIKGQKLGKLKEVSPTGGADIFIVNNNNNKEYMIPASKEIIKSIDESSKKIIIDPIPGLLDL